MSRRLNHWYFWIGTAVIAVTCACGLVSPGASSSSTGNANSSGSNGSSSSQAYAYTPNPLNVQITLDTQHVMSAQGEIQPGVINMETLTGKDPKGDNLDVTFPGDFLTQAADGTYEPAYGTKVTATPVSDIGGIPFAKGFVSAFQFGPEGLLMTQPVTVELTVPGSYTDLVGFASNGDGTDFHLIPIDASPLGTTGQTIATFSLDHFSMYGVAEATTAEVAAQTAHPPSDAGDNDDDLLAAPTSKKQQVLDNEHNRLLNEIKNHSNCNDVVAAARDFFTWYGHAQSANLLNSYKSQIASDSASLTSLLKSCIVIACPICMQSQSQSKNQSQANQQTQKQKQAAAHTVMVQANFIEYFDALQNNSSDANYYRELSRKCATAAGLKDPLPPVADCQGSADCGKVTPTELACPAP